MSLQIFVLDHGVFFPGAEPIRKVFRKAQAAGGTGFKEQRKFVVLKPKDFLLDVVLLIGEVLMQNRWHEDSYFHQDLINKRPAQCARLECGGGGLVKLEHFATRWSANFGGSSRELGIFDPSLLFYGTELVEELAVDVVFEWQGRFRKR